MAGNDRDGPLEVFKRANAACFRAVSKRPELEVVYGSDPAHMTGERARLPLPSRQLPPEEIAQARGEGDQLACRLRYHDGKAHSALRPTGEVAPVLFDALETARVEAMGSKDRSGLQANLAAALDQKYRRMGFHRIEERTESTMPEVVRLLAREYMTGEAPPPSAQRVVDLWRDHIGPKIEGSLETLAPLMKDQRAYAEAARKLIRAMDIDMGREDPSDSSDDGRDDGSAWRGRTRRFRQALAA